MYLAVTSIIDSLQMNEREVHTSSLDRDSERSTDECCDRVSGCLFWSTSLDELCTSRERHMLIKNKKGRRRLMNSRVAHAQIVKRFKTPVGTFKDIGF